MKDLHPVTLVETAALLLPAATACALLPRLELTCATNLIAACGVLFLYASGAVFLLSKRRAPGTVMIVVLVFALSFLYTESRIRPVPFPQGRTRVTLKLVSDSSVKRGGRMLQYTARVVAADKTAYPASARVLFNVGVPKNVPRGSLERGAVVKTEGVFVLLDPAEWDGYARYLQSRGIQAVFEGHASGLTIERETRKHGFYGVSNRLKRYITGVNRALLFFPQSDFATALLTGNRETVPPEVMERFIRSGTLHILAVSGLHVGFIGFFIFLLLRSVRLPTVLIYAAVGCATFFYMLFIGDSPSVRRASLMVLCGTALFFFDRDKDYINVLALTFVVLWVLNPLVIFGPGFLLSFSATFGILFLVPPLRRLLARTAVFRFKAVDHLVSLLLVSFSVQLYILPVLLAFFGSFPYVNLLANVPIVPLAGLSLALEICYLLLYPVFMPLAVLAAESNLVVVTLILRIASFFAAAPPIAVDGFPRAVIPIYWVAITLLFYLLFWRRETIERGDAAAGRAVRRW
ncbi:MAG: ComEC/Rec2 family competence protein [Spirochaetes bacterium]|nr:ComEC/Rec2 family competence protein [Spirochaetota bacterium]